MAGAAQAADPIKLSLGGYSHTGLTIRSQDYTASANPDRNSDGILLQTSINAGRDDHFVQNNGLQVTTDIGRSDVFWEAEVFFVGETTLDNGIKVGVNIQLEAYTSSDQIDEHYVYLSGGFGRLVAGAENSASYIMHYAAPTPTGGQFGAESPNFNPFRLPTAHRAGSIQTFMTLTSDANKITYYTPRFSPGFQFGISYTPDDDAFAGTQLFNGAGDCRGGCAFDAGNGVSDNDQSNHHHFIELGMNFVKSINGVDLAFDLGYGTAFVEKQVRGVSQRAERTTVTAGGGLPRDARVGTGENDKLLKQRHSITTGFNVGYAGWTFGGGFRWDNLGQQGQNNQYHATAGAMYGAGPWLLGVNAGYAIAQDGRRGDSSAAGGYVRRTNDTTLWLGGQGTYTLGPGVRVFASLDYADWNGNGTKSEEGDGVAISSGLLINF